MELRTHGPKETERVVMKLSQVLKPGTVVALKGGLGVGKTALTRGLARGLGILDPVNSPTYTIVNEYTGGKIPLFHFDMYRLHSAEDLFDIGWDDYLERNGICVVEWSETVWDALENPVIVEIERVEGADEDRIIRLEGVEIPCES